MYSRIFFDILLILYYPNVINLNKKTGDTLGNRLGQAIELLKSYKNG